MIKYKFFFSIALLSLHAGRDQFVGYSYYETAPLRFLTSLKNHKPHGYHAVPEGVIEVVQGNTSFISSYNSEDIATYFSPFAKKRLVVKEDVTANGNPLMDKGSQDILSYNFNVVTQEGIFESILEFKPTKRVWASDISFNIRINDEWWVNAFIPFAYVRTNMNLDEQIQQTSSGASQDPNDFRIAGSDPVGSMKEAFANKNMKYGRINGPRSEIGFSDIVIKVGKEYTDRSTQRFIRPYVGMVFPTSNKPQAEYMFEPVLGNGRHAGLVAGGEWGNRLGYYKNCDISLEGITQITYLLPNHQMRSFDPGGKPWGRYLTMFANEDDMNNQRYSFGINECTKRAKVKPGIQFVNNIAMNFAHEKGTLKLGYQTTARASDHVSLPSAWTAPAIASIDQMEARTNPARGINNVLDDFKSANYQGIQKHEISTQTVAHPFYVAHHVVCAFNKTIKRNYNHYNLEVGTTVSFGFNNAVAHEWGIYGSLMYSL